MAGEQVEVILTSSQNHIEVVTKYETINVNNHLKTS